MYFIGDGAGAFEGVEDGWVAPTASPSDRGQDGLQICPSSLGTFIVRLHSEKDGKQTSGQEEKAASMSSLSPSS